MDMPKHYQVKYRVKGSKKWKYGIFQTWGNDVEKLWKVGRCLVADAVLPINYQLSYDATEIVDIPFGTPGWDKENNCSIPGDEFAQYILDQFNKTKETSEKATGLKGKMFSINVADGYAYYVVVKENKKTVKVEWRGFCLDRYTDQIMGWECTVDKSRIADIVRREEGFKALLAKK